MVDPVVYIIKSPAEAAGVAASSVDGESVCVPVPLVLGVNSASAAAACCCPVESLWPFMVGLAFLLRIKHQCVLVCSRCVCLGHNCFTIKLMFDSFYSLTEHKDGLPLLLKLVTVNKQIEKLHFL